MPQIKALFNGHISILSKQYSTVIEKSEFNSIVIHAGSLHYSFLDDRTYPFMVNPHFKYWLPIINNPDCFIRITPGKKPELLYFKATDFWHEMPEDPNGFWVDSFDIKMISSLNEAKSVLGDLTSSAYIGEHFSSFKEWGFKAENPESMILEFHFMRAVKTEYEQYCLREANKHAAKAHTVAKEAFYSGASEYEINKQYLESVGILGHETPYGNIIALNENGAILHYTNCRTEKPNEHHSFLIDAGVQFNGYASDITRTYSFKKDEFNDLILAMDEAQHKMIANIKLNVSYTENHLKSHVYIAEILEQFGFVNLPAEAIVEKKISHTFFPHGLGHFLGLQVHDVGGFLKNPQGTQISAPEDHPFLRCTRVIQEGHVFTIEPGLYFIEPLLSDIKKTENSSYLNWEKIESFMKYGGIRIEDNICMKKDGFENFTRDAFASL